MLSENPFSDVGCILSGERVIGRSDEIRQVRNRLCCESGYGSLAIVGMPRIGKSSLVQGAILDEAPALAQKRIVCARIEVGTCASFDDLLSRMVRDTLGQIREHKLSSAMIESKGAQTLAAGGEGRWDEARTFFRLVKEAKVRPICVLDEFDVARKLFQDGARCFHAVRELASNPAFKAGLVLICKRELGEVAQLAGHPSTYWANVVKEMHLRGFDESGLDCFFKRLEQAGIALRKDVREELLPLCGAHPYFLDAFASEAFPLVRAGKPLHGSGCRNLIEPYFSKAFSDLVEVLKDGPWLGKLKAAIFEAKSCHPRQALQFLVSYGVLRETSAGKLVPFSSALPDYLRSFESECDAAARTPNQPVDGSEERATVSPHANKQTGPFQFDQSQTALKAASGIVTKLPPRFGLVLKEMLKVDSRRFGTLTSCLAYEEVAIAYSHGQAEEQPSKRAALAARIRKKGTQASKLQAQQFKRDFGRWLEVRGIDITKIVVVDSKQGGYRIQPTGWDARRPVIYGSEVAQFSAAPSILDSVAGDDPEECVSAESNSDNPP